MLFQKVEAEGILPNSWGQHYPNIKIKHKKLQTADLMNANLKILNKIANWIQQCIKRIMHHDQMGFIPGMQDWFNT